MIHKYKVCLFWMILVFVMQISADAQFKSLLTTFRRNLHKVPVVCAGSVGTCRWPVMSAGASCWSAAGYTPCRALCGPAATTRDTTKTIKLEIEACDHWCIISVHINNKIKCDWFIMVTWFPANLITVVFTCVQRAHPDPALLQR